MPTVGLHESPGDRRAAQRTDAQDGEHQADPIMDRRLVRCQTREGRRKHALHAGAEESVDHGEAPCPCQARHCSPAKGKKARRENHQDESVDGSQPAVGKLGWKNAPGQTNGVGDDEEIEGCRAWDMNDVLREGDDLDVYRDQLAVQARMSKANTTHIVVCKVHAQYGQKHTSTE